MNDRERKLASGLGLVAGLMALFWGYGQFTDRLSTARLSAITAENELNTTSLLLKSTELYEKEREWLDQKNIFAEDSTFRKPSQIARTELLTFAKDQAVSAGLEVRKEGLQPTDETGAFFSRAKVEFQVTGQEASLYRWLDRLNSPDDLRTVTYLKLSPNRADDTLVDGLVMVELFYVPQDAVTDEESVPDSPAPQPVIPGLDS